MSRANQMYSPVARVNTRLAYTALAVVSLGYIGLTLAAPISTATRTYSLSPWAVHSLQLSVALPIVAIWFTALWGSLRFKQYAEKIYSNADGRALNVVATGLLTLVASLAITSLIQAANPGMIAAGHAKPWTLLGEYSGVVLSVTAFGIIGRGALKLAQIVKLRGVRQGSLAALAALAVMGILYGWFMAKNPYRLSSPDPARYSSYYLPDWLIIATIMVPYLVVWYCGLLAVVYLRCYQKFSSGIIYRKALSRLAAGLFAVIMASLLIQLLNALSPSLAHVGLGNILFLLYGLVIIYAVGHVLVVIGARRLSKIEEVS